MKHHEDLKSHSKRKIAFIAVAMSMALLGGCGDDDTDTAPAAPPAPTAPPNEPGTTEVVINIPEGATGQGPAAYGENPRVVQPGTRVTWVNQDSVPHTATADDGSWDSGTLNTGQNFSRVFDTPGTYPYYCLIHGKASMSGVIQVSDAAGSSPTPSPSPSASPSVTPSPSASPSDSPSPIVSPLAISIPAGATGRGSAAYGEPRTVPRGTRVTWTNDDSMPHSVTADDGSFDSGTMVTGQTFSHTFLRAGEFPYFCEIHGKASMSGIVRVTP